MARSELRDVNNVTIKTNSTRLSSIKIEVWCMWIGFIEGNARDYYLMWIPSTANIYDYLE